MSIYDTMHLPFSLHFLSHPSHIPFSGVIIINPENEQTFQGLSSPSVASCETVLSFSLLSCISHVIITCQYISPDPISLLSTRRIHPTTQSKFHSSGMFLFRLKFSISPNYTPAFINALSQNKEQGNNQIWFLVSNLTFPVLVGFTTFHVGTKVQSLKLINTGFSQLT